MADSVQSWTQSVDSFFTSTWSHRKGPAVEQAFEKNPFALYMKSKGRAQAISGFSRIEIPLEYASNETVRWITKGSTVPITDTEFLTMAYEDWKYVSVSITRWFTEDQQNKGKARLINYAEAKVASAERAMQDEFERVICADGSGSNEPNGLQNLIATDPTTGTVHGINRATAGNEYFRNTTKTATGTASVYLLSDMSNILNTVTKYSRAQQNDIVIMTDQTSFETYEEETMEQKQIVNKTLGDAGFQTFSFKGRPLMWSPSAPASQMRFVNTNYLKLVYDPTSFMDMTSWKEIPNQVNDRVAQIVSSMQMLASRPVCNGVLTIS